MNLVHVGTVILTWSGSLGAQVWETLGCKDSLKMCVGLEGEPMCATGAGRLEEQL